MCNMKLEYFISEQPLITEQFAFNKPCNICQQQWHTQCDGEHSVSENSTIATESEQDTETDTEKESVQLDK